VKYTHEEIYNTIQYLTGWSAPPLLKSVATLPCENNINV